MISSAISSTKLLSHATSVARTCNFHAHAIRHIRHLLTTELALTLACSLILSRLLQRCRHGCAVGLLHGAPASSIQKLQRVQNTAARIVLRVPRQSPSQPLLEELHWLPVRQRIDYKLAVLTYKIRNTSTPAYLSHHIRPRESTRTSPPFFNHTTTPQTDYQNSLRRPRVPLLAPTVWNSLNTDTLCCNSL